MCCPVAHLFRDEGQDFTHRYGPDEALPYDSSQGKEDFEDKVWGGSKSWQMEKLTTQGLLKKGQISYCRGHLLLLFEKCTLSSHTCTCLFRLMLVGQEMGLFTADFLLFYKCKEYSFFFFLMFKCSFVSIDFGLLSRHCCAWAFFLQLRRAGATLCCGVWASHCGGFLCCRTWALCAWASVLVVHRPSCSMACGIFSDQGSNLRVLHWLVNSYPWHHQVCPHSCSFI